MQYKDNENVFFSIIVPVYNAEKYLEECIKSVVTQTFNNWELLLINDGSKDNSGEIAELYAQKDSRIIVIHQENSGQTAARKKGMISCKGQYVLFLDSDDWIEQDTLEKCYEEVKINNPAMVVFGYKEIKKGSVQEVPVTFPKGKYNKNEIENMIYPQLLMDENGKFFPRALWGKVYKKKLIASGLYSVPDVIRNGEDMCCVIQCVLNAETISVLKETFYGYRIDVNGSVSRSGDAQALKRCRVMAKFLDSIIPVENHEIKKQYRRLLVQQIYSAVVRSFDAMGINQNFLVLYDNVEKDSLCKDAIKHARFSMKAYKLILKQIILKYRLFWLMKVVR